MLTITRNSGRGVAVTATTSEPLVFDSNDRELVRDPHALLRRLRDEAPLYYSEEHDFYALSRYADVEHALVDRETFISGRGVTVNQIKAGIEFPPGTVLIEDPPTHTIHRKLMSRMFTPKAVSQLEDKTRQFCVDLLDPFVGSDGFDFAQEIGVQVPSRVISMLIGIPDADRDGVRDTLFANAASGDYSQILSGELFEEYIDWRVEHPSDDIMTTLLNAEFEDENGRTTRLTRDEVLAYVNIVALAGNDTTRLLIGWMGQLLGDHPDQRRALVDDPSLIPNAVEESLRYEGPAGQSGRYVTRDVELYGQTVPAGSAIALVMLAANRDERKFEDPDRFDVRRPPNHMLTFGFGTHYCLGQGLARMEARVVLEEVLTRFPDWEVDLSGAVMMDSGLDIRGWDHLPIVLG
jgi:cytochrome P450